MRNGAFFIIEISELRLLCASPLRLQRCINCGMRGNGVDHSPHDRPALQAHYSLAIVIDGGVGHICRADVRDTIVYYNQLGMHNSVARFASAK